MTRVLVVIREVGKLNPEYSLNFDLPEVPAVGSYISIHRPDKPSPYGEDLIVRQIWWQLEHPETQASTSSNEQEKVGRLAEVVVECEQAIGPWSSDHWRDMLERRREHGSEIPDLEVARVSVRQDAFEKPSRS